MKYIVIKIEKIDKGNEKDICETIGDMIERGYSSGMGSPVDWSIEKSKHVKIK